MFLDEGGGAVVVVLMPWWCDRSSESGSHWGAQQNAKVLSLGDTTSLEGCFSRQVQYEHTENPLLETFNGLPSATVTLVLIMTGNYLDLPTTGPTGNW